MLCNVRGRAYYNVLKVNVCVCRFVFVYSVFLEASEDPGAGIIAGWSSYLELKREFVNENIDLIDLFVL